VGCETWVKVMECKEAESQRSNSVQERPEAVKDVPLEVWGTDLRHGSLCDGNDKRSLITRI
jgi:hypothetical protein